MILSKKSMKILKQLIEVRFVKSQKKGWVPIVRGDRDWNSGISEDELLKLKIEEAEQKEMMRFV
tara:strand:- start:218 stop:409 length:192 start_codon:yes stop_codon:yes gene_type:complete